MRLVIINGSPRGVKSNSKVFVDWIVSGLDKNTEIQQFYAVQAKTHKKAVEAIQDNTTVLIVFPLYVDSMPSITKLFIEELDSIAKKTKNVKIYFAVQSGFGGAKHSRGVERYLVYLAKHMGFEYMGTAIKPASEGTRFMSEDRAKITWNRFVDLAKDIQLGNIFNEKTLKELAGYEVPSEEYKAALRKRDGEVPYFTHLLKENNAYDDRFNKPYVKSDTK